MKNVGDTSAVLTSKGFTRAEMVEGTDSDVHIWVRRADGRRVYVETTAGGVVAVGLSFPGTVDDQLNQLLVL